MGCIRIRVGFLINGELILLNANSFISVVPVFLAVPNILAIEVMPRHNQTDCDEEEAASPNTTEVYIKICN